MLDMVQDSVEPFYLPTGMCLTVRPSSPGSVGSVSILDGAVLFTSGSTAATGSYTVGPFQVPCKLAVSARGSVSVEVLNSALVTGAGTSTARTVDEVSIFQAELRTNTTPLTPDNANVTVTFTRNFALATLQANGLYAEAAHQTAAFAWVPGANRYMLAGSGSAVGLIFSAGGESRDLTLSGWVKTNMTAAKNVTGVDGTANSASSITATAALATVLFPTTATALARTYQAQVSRRAGYGRVWMTGDGGTSWADITARVGLAFGRVHIPVTGANPSLGFMLENSGDAINVDSAACIASPYPVPYAFLSRADLQGQSLTYTGARKTTANPAFSIEFDWYYDDTPSGTVQLSNGGSYPILVALQSTSTPPPSIQLLPSASALYAGNPTLFVGTKKVTAQQVHKYRLVIVGQTVHSYLDGVLVGIYDTQTPPAGLVPANFKDFVLTPGNGNYTDHPNISDFLGRVIVALGDSISVIESYRQAWLKAMPEGAIFCQRGVSGNTVAQVRDRVAADLALSLPAGNACTVFAWDGTNSLANNMTPAAVLAEKQQEINNILAINQNAKIIVPTVFTYRTGGLTGIDAATFAANATTYNAGLSSLTGITKVVEMNDAESTVSTFFLADGIHPKGPSYGSIVRKLAPWVA